MKKFNLEKLSNKDLFGSFEESRLKLLASTNLKGGTSTTLCKTDENQLGDLDSQAGQENPNDKRCMPPP
ncbi:hypothetical protein [Pedobacter sp. D749]|uniref:hypothetical protein n=1 Tax=Pedobacter sp. D749 TaxID=2856523 RepID=UPI001C5750ED|nr:hypothetical protein [Pedobacter sp. D749]QXU43170.1 hypothetical protein KYH19_06170 [Pedobacter sp. D749]